MRLHPCAVFRGVLKHLGRHFANHIVVLEGWNETVRWDQAVIGMLPAHERFNAREGASGEGDLWLVVIYERMTCKCIAQFVGGEIRPFVRMAER